jgi:hypothetical protein
LLSVKLTENQPISLKTEDFLAWPRVAAPVTLLAIDLTKPFDLVLREQISFVLERDVEHLGVALAFRATLAPGIVHSTLAGDVEPLNSWRYALWPALEQPAFARGATAVVDYAYERGASSIIVRPA